MTDTKENTSKMMTVKTGYARITLMLMAINLLMTGYAIAALANIHETTYGAQESAPALAPAPASVQETVKPQD